MGLHLNDEMYNDNGGTIESWTSGLGNIALQVANRKCQRNQRPFSSHGSTCLCSNMTVTSKSRWLDPREGREGYLAYLAP